MNDFSTACGLSEPLRLVYTHRATGATNAATLSEPYALLGRHPQNSIRLDDPSVSKKHAYLQVIDGCPFVVDLGARTGVRIGGEPLAMGWVEAGDTLQIGEFDIALGHTKRVGNRPSPMAASPNMSPLELACWPGEDHSHTPSHPIPIRSALSLIGRDLFCNLHLRDERVRPFHAALVEAAGDIWLIDLPGSGGTRLNGRLARCAMLQVGDRIGLNGLQLDVRLSRSAIPFAAADTAMAPVPETMGRFTAAGEIAQSLPDQIGDLRRATVLMASLFGEMKREQTQLMQRQIELMEVMTQAFRDSRSGGTVSQVSPLPPPNGLPHTPAPAGVPLQMPRAAKPDDEAALARAHEWFLSRLGALGKPPS